MARSGLAGFAAGGACFAATVVIAFDAGGYHALAWDRALVVLSGTAFVLLVAFGAERPGRFALVTVGAFALLTAWTAASWLWSDSPPSALVEAQRTAAYLAASLAVVAAGRRASFPWVVGGVAAGAASVAGWNLALRLAPDWTGRAPVSTDIGALADPIGYANGLAALDAVGALLLLGAALAARRREPRVLAAVLLVPVAADIVLQQSDGATVALGAGLLAFLVAAGERAGWSAVALLVLPVIGAVAVAREHGVVAPPASHITEAAHPGHRLLLGLALLAAAQAALAQLLPPGFASRFRVRARTGAAVAAVVVVAAVAAAPFALVGHERRHYWRAAAHEIAARPILGSGAGTYVVWWVRKRTVPLSTQEAHSLYIETLAELGPVGLLALVAALAAPLAGVLRLRALPWGPPVLAALVAYDVHAAVDFDWELAGVTLPVILLATSAAVHASPAGAALGSRVRAGVALGIALLATAGVLALVGTSRLAAAQEDARSGRFSAAVAQAHGALRFAPWSAAAWRVIGESQLARGDRAAARAAFRSATELDPADWQTWWQLASVSTGKPRRSALAEATRLNPLGASGS